MLKYYQKNKRYGWYFFTRKTYCLLPDYADKMSLTSTLAFTQNTVSGIDYKPGFKYIRTNYLTYSNKSNDNIY
jgi:hypothetical protein